MTLPVWPPVLPLPQLAGFALMLGDANNVRSTLAGPPMSRQRSTRQAVVVSATLVLNDLRMAIFEAWWRYLLFDGVSWFSIPLLGETGIADVLARASGGYAAEMLEIGIWRVNFPLTLDDPPRSG